MLALRARYVLPITSPPIAHGVVVVEGEQIVEVGAGAQPAQTVDLGNVALLPGLINAHTHLEFSLLPQPLGHAGMAFPDWIAAVVRWRRDKELAGESADQWRREAVQAGLAESCRAGVTTLADVLTSPWPRDAYRDAAAEVVALAEFLALTGPRASQQWDQLCGFLSETASGEAGLTWGLSPHAPYTVRWETLSRLCGLSADKELALAMHLAESRDELEFLRIGSGPLRALLENLNAWDTDAVPRGLCPRDYLQILSRAHRALVIHGNYLTADEIRFLGEQRQRMAVIYCPRTHAGFAHSRYPLAEMRSAGVRVALGTDSRASSPDLQLLEEMRCAGRNHPEVAPEVIVELGTLAAAAALGQQSRLGSLAADKQADLVAISLPAAGDRGPYAFLADRTCRVERVYKAGQLVAVAE